MSGAAIHEFLWGEQASEPQHSVSKVVSFVSSATGTRFERKYFFWGMWRERKYKVFERDSLVTNVYIKVLAEGSPAVTYRKKPAEDGIVVEAYPDKTMVRELTTALQLTFSDPGVVPEDCVGVPGKHMERAYAHASRKAVFRRLYSLLNDRKVYSYDLHKYIKICPYRAVRSWDYVRECGGLE